MCVCVCVCVCVCAFVCGGSPHPPVWKTLLRVNETKRISEMTFIVDLFALGGEKSSPYDKRTFFAPPPLRCSELSFNP